MWKIHEAKKETSPFTLDTFLDEILVFKLSSERFPGGPWENNQPVASY
jgi:hypothetical protein